MGFVDAAFVKGFIQMGDDGWQQGWHERNGGNLSYRIRPEEVESVRSYLTEGSWQSIGAQVPDLAGEYFLVTGSGKYFRNCTLDPENTLCMLEIDGTGERYRIVWGLTNGGRPTSELPSHLLNHQVKKRVTDGKFRVIYHAHPENIIALTFVLPPSDEVFTRELWEMISECSYVFPEGVGVVEWMVPGSLDIGLATSRLMETYNVAIWAHHGMFAAGETFDETFGLMHTVEKAAQILVKVISMGGKRHYITADNLRKFAKDCSFRLNERFLNDEQ